VAALLGLLAAAGFGASDFAAGLVSRRLSAALVAATAQFLGLLTAVGAVVVFPGVGPRAGALAWGALAGVGSAGGTLALYHGLSVGRMSVVATLSAVILAVVPALVGVALGESLATRAVIGIVLAVPAIVLVSLSPGRPDELRELREPGPSGMAPGAIFGILAGIGFALLFVALDQAKTRSGAWPMIPDQAVSLVLLTPLAVRRMAGVGRPARGTLLLMLTSGLLSGTANLLFLAATGHGELAVVAVLTSMYPAVTVVLARALLAERWSRPQVAGLLSAAFAVALVSIK
jgi:uncharacterized membrane protein